MSAKACEWIWSRSQRRVQTEIFSRISPGMRGEERRRQERREIGKSEVEWIGADWSGLESVLRHVAWARARARDSGMRIMGWVGYRERKHE
jgi:hypothetical protein